MAELKTKKTKASVAAFISSIEDEQKRKDAKTVAALMRKATGSAPKMWGPSIVGFGSFTYRYKSGKPLDWFVTGFSPRKQALTLYIMSGLQAHGDLMKGLGKYKTGKGCLYVKSLDDVDMPTLKKLIAESVKATKKRKPDYK